MSIYPETISEELLYATVRLETNQGSWTWFFFHFNIGEKIYPTLITNKHVINYKEEETVKFHLHENILGKPDWNFEIEFKSEWIFHPDESIDLCCCLVQPLFNHVNISLWKNVFYKNIDSTFIQDNEKLKELNTLEDSVMVWYPNWLWDEKHNFPLFRKGITSSHPAIDFNRDWVWVVDMACFPWSSWSPIFILNEWVFKPKNWNLMAWSRIIFLGVLFEWPQMNSKWGLIIEDVPTLQRFTPEIPVMINLGYYIKAQKILDLEWAIREHYIL